jgi:N-acyl-D-aspartate/D-glutamate deacylase
MEYDLLIKGGLLVDGSGQPAYRGDLAVSDQRIAAIGPDLGKNARQIIDAGGLVVTPGFIDPHTHYDAQLLWDNLASPSSAFGVTTIVIGNCGFAIAPCRPENRESTMRDLVKVEGMSLKALKEGISWEWETYPEYLSVLEKQKPALNVATLLGHSPLRVYAMGQAAYERAANETERQKIKQLFREALEVGAFGLGTSTATNHFNEAGQPMPSRMASEEEFNDLEEVFREVGRGTFEITPSLDGSLEWLANFARRSGRPTTWALLMSSPLDRQRHRAILKEVEKYQREGLRLYPQTGCFPLTMDFSLESAYPFEGLPVWQRLFKTERQNWPEVFRDPVFRRQFSEQAGSYPSRLFPGDWNNVEVLDPVNPANAGLRHRPIMELAREQGKNPVDTFFDLALSEDLRTMFSVALLNTIEEDVLELISHPGVLIAASDAGAHQTLLCDAGYTARMLGYWVRERKLLGLEKAVASLTGIPAAVYGIKDRGRLTPGFWADLVIYDPATIMDGPKRLVNDLPGGEPRLVRDCQGIIYSIVNGQPLVNPSGQTSDALSNLLKEGKLEPKGQVLRANH